MRYTDLAVDVGLQTHSETLNAWPLTYSAHNCRRVNLPSLRRPTSTGLASKDDERGSESDPITIKSSSESRMRASSVEAASYACMYVLYSSSATLVLALRWGIDRLSRLTQTAAACDFHASLVSDVDSDCACRCSLEQINWRQMAPEGIRLELPDEAASSARWKG